MKLDIPFSHRRLKLFCNELWPVVADQRGQDSHYCVVCLHYTDYCCRCSDVQTVNFPPGSGVADRQQVVFVAPKEQLVSDFLPGKSGFFRHDRLFLLHSTYLEFYKLRNHQQCVFAAIPDKKTHSHALAPCCLRPDEIDGVVS